MLGNAFPALGARWLGAAPRKRHRSSPLYRGLIWYRGGESGAPPGGEEVFTPLSPTGDAQRAAAPCPRQGSAFHPARLLTPPAEPRPPPPRRPSLRAGGRRRRRQQSASEPRRGQAGLGRRPAAGAGLPDALCSERARLHAGTCSPPGPARGRSRRPPSGSSARPLEGVGARVTRGAC